ncbi:hypothetical protein [uncultured Paracoccus sp.]|uniref:hypothetical protein n=1 Tax=uncultured Paracoccus sp. TaxID=189685 RepID=UPI00261769E6|nr:hypothetical protein [uncultured Paracoccus sp.]
MADAQAPAYKPLYVRFKDDGDIAEIVDMFRPLRIANIIPNAVVFAPCVVESASGHPAVAIP